MQIVRFIDNNGNTCLGTDVSHGSAIRVNGRLFENLEVTGDRIEISRILSPLDPKAIMCIGLNYKAHAQETGMRLPEYPVLFMKNPASVTGHENPIVLPKSCMDPLQVDYEAELAVIIGKDAKNVSADDAMAYVYGYTIANDVSARIWQNTAGGKQWVRGKSFDTFCPLGPYIVTADGVDDPDNLGLKCVLNASVMQDSRTADMIFSVSELIEYLSSDTTLLKGTVILTGTPSGVGFTRNPPVFLKPGDVVEVMIEGLGVLRNPVVAG